MIRVSKGVNCIGLHLKSSMFSASFRTQTRCRIERMEMYKTKLSLVVRAPHFDVSFHFALAQEIQELGHPL